MKKNPLIIKNAVLAMGGTIEEFIPERGCFYINVMGKKILLERKFSLSRQSFVSRELTRSKDITHKLLCASNLPTPKTECFYKKSYNQEQAKQQLKNLKYPIILKHARGSNSVGIFPLSVIILTHWRCWKKSCQNILVWLLKKWCKEKNFVF